MGANSSLPLKERIAQNERRLSQMGNRGAEIVGDSKNAQLIKNDLIHAYNMRDRKTLRNFLAPGGTFSFKGAEACMPLADFIEQAEILQLSFPDIALSYDEIKEVREGVVKVLNFRSKGTHTGKPYAYGPFPAVPTTGKVVEQEICDFTLLVTDGKLTHFEIIMKGDIIGPAGYYESIGGKMELSH